MGRGLVQRNQEGPGLIGKKELLKVRASALGAFARFVCVLESVSVEPAAVRDKTGQQCQMQTSVPSGQEGWASFRQSPEGSVKPIAQLNSQKCRDRQAEDIVCRGFTNAAMQQRAQASRNTAQWTWPAEIADRTARG